MISKFHYIVYSGFWKISCPKNGLDVVVMVLFSSVAIDWMTEAMLLNASQLATRVFSKLL